VISKEFTYRSKLGNPIDLWSDLRPGEIIDDEPNYHRMPIVAPPISSIPIGARFKKTDAENGIDKITGRIQDAKFYTSGACRNSPEKFIGSGRPSKTALAAAYAAIQVCNSCPVAETCLEYGLETAEFDHPYTIYGGQTVKDIFNL
jgi:hypothetical protein